jgi:hypothetical protein
MIRRTFQGSRSEPAECQNTNPANCIVCGNEHDLDDGDDYTLLEGMPAVMNEPIICDDCHLKCALCGEDVTRRANAYGKTKAVFPEVYWKLGDPYCGLCEEV